MKLFNIFIVFLVLSGAYAYGDSAFNEKIINISQKSLFQYLKYGSIDGFYYHFKTEKNHGVFVTLTKDGVVRGCMGTIFPKCSNLGEEVAKNTTLAASADIRYPRITMEEYPFIKYHISFVKNVRLVNNISELNPKKLGLLIKYGNKSAVLLPGEAKTTQWQISECRRKAGIKQNEPVLMYVFETDIIEN